MAYISKMSLAYSMLYDCPCRFAASRREIFQCRIFFTISHLFHSWRQAPPLPVKKPTLALIGKKRGE